MTSGRVNQAQPGPSPPSPSDPTEFYQRWIAGRKARAEDYRQLLELLWRACGREVFLFARARTRDNDKAADVCSETFLRALRWLSDSGGRRPDKLNFPAWLQRIALNLIITERRRPRLLRAWPGDDESQAPWDPADPRETDVDDRMATAEELAALRCCMEELPEDWRRLIRWRELDGLSYEDIVTASGLNIKTVGSRLYRARKDLRDCVELRLAS